MKAIPSWGGGDILSCMPYQMEYINNRPQICGQMWSHEKKRKLILLCQYLQNIEGTLNLKKWSMDGRVSYGWISNLQLSNERNTALYTITAETYHNSCLVA